MTALEQMAGWSVFFGLVLVARLLTTRPAVRILGPRVRRLGRWAQVRLSPEEEVDPETEELAWIQRRQRLEVHLERVRRLLVTDMGMSATRQLGNRLAYASLRHEIARIPDPSPSPGPGPVWAARPLRDSRSPSSTVEILEIGGWR